MNVAAILQAPWRCTRSATHWYQRVLVGVLMTAGVALLLGGPKLSLAGLMLLGFAEFIFGALLLAPTLLLALDGRQLRMPGIGSDMVTAVLLYGIVGCVLPTALVALAGLDNLLLDTVGVAASALLAGIALSLLPRYALMVVWLAPMLSDIAGWHPRFPRPGEAGFAGFCGELALLLTVVSAASWRRQMCLADPYRQNASWAPMALHYRRVRLGWSGSDGGRAAWAVPSARSGRRRGCRCRWTCAGPDRTVRNAACGWRWAGCSRR